MNLFEKMNVIVIELNNTEDIFGDELWKINKEAFKFDEIEW